MKKIIITFLALSLLLCGCANSNKNDVTTTKSTTNYQTEKESNTSDKISNTAPNPEKVDVSSNELSTDSITWGPGNIKNHEVPVDPKKLQEKYKTLSAKWLLDDKKSICLTFDEGYENGYTASILDTLKEKNVKAIFFCTYDYVKNNHELVKRMIDEGHTVANHSYSHLNMTKLDTKKASEEVMMNHDYVKENFGYEMKYFRFPEGAFSEQNLETLKSLNYKSVFWSFAYADWDRNSQPNPQEAFEKITSSTHDGAIFLLHAVSKTNAEILADLIDNIKEQGYNFTTKL